MTWSASGNDDADYVRNDLDDVARLANGKVESFEETEIDGYRAVQGITVAPLDG